MFSCAELWQTPSDIRRLSVLLRRRVFWPFTLGLERSDIAPGFSAIAKKCNLPNTRVIVAGRYDWQRYWVPREGSFAFDLEGFLAPAASQGGWSFWKTDVVGFHEISGNPCLILLGEPGIGKTVALEDARELVRKERPSAGILHRNLGTYGDEKRLVDDIFGSDEFFAWASRGGELHLFLDSFDECLLRLDTVAAILVDRLKTLGSVDGLFFRIASRTAEWRAGLEEVMRMKWGDEAVKAYELAPLTKQQVQVAAETQVSAPDKFIHEVIEREVVSFAIKPVTLDLLLRIWKAGSGSLPPTQREIYELGCIELCSESNPDRDTPRLRRELCAEQRLAVASQIAAATVFCQRSAIWNGTKPSHKLETDLSRSELCYGSVLVSGQEMIITEKALRETLDTGLFTARGPNRLGWAHQTYAEYLAARYLQRQQPDTKQVLDLLFHPSDPSNKLVPQLRETAGWIAVSNNDVFERLLESEPDVLLLSDIATAHAEVKAKLVQALLSAADSPEFRPDWWALRKRYRKLKSPGLSASLGQVLMGKKQPRDARVEAIHVAEACELSDLHLAFVELALDADEDQEVRETAADAVSRLGDSSISRRLKPLALGSCGEDRNDELRAAGLLSCWPGIITADELFSALKEPSSHITGRYSQFLDRSLVDGLTREDLPRALRWAAAQPEDHDPRKKFPWLVRWILERSVAHLDDDQILEEFAEAMLARLRKHDFAGAPELSEIARKFEMHPEWRLRVVEAMLPLFQDAHHDSLLITRWGFPFIRTADLDWLLSRLRGETSPEVQRKLCYLVYWVFYPEDAKRIDSVIAAARHSTVLEDVLAIWLKPMALGSEAATKAKRDFDENQRWTKAAKQSGERPPLTPAPADHMVELLGRCESGDMDAWWQICTVAGLEDNGKPADQSHHIDIRDLPGWKKAADETKTRLIVAAHCYVTSRAPEADVWFHWTGRIYWPAVAGVRALLLLAQEAPQLFDGLGKEVWIHWLPAILRLHPFNETNKYLLLVTRAFEKAPHDAVRWASKVVDEENREGDYLWVLQKLPRERNSRLESMLLSKFKTVRLKQKCASQLMGRLAEQQVDGAINVARRWLPRKSPVPKRQLEKGLFAAQLLLKHGGGKDWKRTRALLDSDPAFGRALFEGLSYGYDHNVGSILTTLSDADVGALWEWLLQEYPPAEDPPERRGGRGGVVTTRWAVANLRDGMLPYLAELATQVACKELVRLTKRYPQLVWIRGILAQARERLRRNSWVAPAPAELFRLFENKQNRLVQSAGQLLDVVLDGLSSLQQKLHGETPAAPFLWDGNKPKDEAKFSDWVKIELQELLIKRGIILNREVQIHIGERTDIHIDAVARSTGRRDFDQVKVIIEAKGCWNPDIKTAMESQLVKRYLTGNDCTHGIYLIGWFVCNAWSGAKGLKFRKLKDLDDYIVAQARDLSVDGLQIRAVILDASLPKVRG